MLLVPAVALLTLTAGCQPQTTDDSAGTTASPPGIPSAATAQDQLDELTVASPGSMTGYSRDLFPHWTESDGCSTRETVLQRDGDDVTTDEDCYPVSGSWYSEYDEDTLTDPSDVDIDHVVPLAEAWRSGAADWSTDQREEFANDLDHPQLIAVSLSSNRSKGDQDPADWQPVESYHCTYSRMWIGAKYAWDLTIDSDEKAALQEMLDTC